MRRPHRHLYPVYQLWRGGYEANVTGLAGMVSYNLLLAIFPFALLLLFVLGTILGSPHDQNVVVQQFEHVFPSIAEGTLRRALDTIRDNATKIGIASGIVGVWIGASFWGSMDTAFGQIYDRPSRPWVHQKLFGIGMLIVSVVFLGASIVLPTLQGLLLSGARHVLPFGLGRVQALGLVIGIAADLVVLFVVTSAIYFAVPRGLVAWRGVWPGALGATIAIGIVNWAFPLYLTHVSTLAKFGTTFAFILIVLIWFYVVAIILLMGGVLNNMRLRESGDQA